jgi:hypothetical protein
MYVKNTYICICMYIYISPSVSKTTSDRCIIPNDDDGDDCDDNSNGDDHNDDGDDSNDDDDDHADCNDDSNDDDDDDSNDDDHLNKLQKSIPYT